MVPTQDRLRARRNIIPETNIDNFNRECMVTKELEAVWFEVLSKNSGVRVDPCISFWVVVKRLVDQRFGHGSLSRSLSLVRAPCVVL